MSPRRPRSGSTTSYPSVPSMNKRPRRVLFTMLDAIDRQIVHNHDHRAESVLPHHRRGDGDLRPDRRAAIPQAQRIGRAARPRCGERPPGPVRVPQCHLSVSYLPERRELIPPSATSSRRSEQAPVRPRRYESGPAHLPTLLPEIFLPSGPAVDVPGELAEPGDDRVRDGGFIPGYVGVRDERSEE